MSPTSWLRCCLVTSAEPPTVDNVTGTSHSEDQTPATNIMEWITVAFVVADQQYITHQHHICVQSLQQQSRHSGNSNHSSSSSSAHRPPMLWLPTCHTMPLQITDHVTRCITAEVTWVHTSFHKKGNISHLEVNIVAWRPSTPALHVIRTTTHTIRKNTKVAIIVTSSGSRATRKQVQGH